MGSVRLRNMDTRGGASRAGSHLAETGEASLEHRAHEAAGDHHVGIHESVANLSAIALGLDDAGGPEHGKVLRDVRLARADRLSQAADLDRTVCQGVQDLEAARARERLEDLCLKDRDLVHTLTIDICADADKCRPARMGGPHVTRLRATGVVVPWSAARRDEGPPREGPFSPPS
jgi:hypothetical protein